MTRLNLPLGALIRGILAARDDSWSPLSKRRLEDAAKEAREVLRRWAVEQGERNVGQTPALPSATVKKARARTPRNPRKLAFVPYRAECSLSEVEREFLDDYAGRVRRKGALLRIVFRSADARDTMLVLGIRRPDGTERLERLGVIDDQWLENPAGVTESIGASVNRATAGVRTP